MSLTALAVRIATIRALRGRTLADDRVFDSKINPVSLVATDEKRPVIIVTTDDDNVNIEGRDLRAGDHSLELVIEVAVTQKVEIEVENEGTKEVLSIPATDAGLEATVGLMGWQIAKALSADGGPWGDLWRVLVVKVISVSSQRGADDANGVRYAARQYIYTIDHIAEPTPGQVPADGDAWYRVLETMKNDPELAGLAKLIETEISGGEYLPWEIARGTLGLANDEATIIGDRPVKIDDVVPLSSIELSDGFIIDPESVGTDKVSVNET